MGDNKDQDGENRPDDEFREMLGEILSGKAGIDPSQLAGAAGLPSDPAGVAALLAQIQGAMNQTSDAIDWSVALTQGQNQARSGEKPTSQTEQDEYEQDVMLATLWLDEAVSMTSLGSGPQLLSRSEWVSKTIPVWTELAEPVALSISDALTRVLTEQAPEELQHMVRDASRMMRHVGGALFAMQLGQVVGQLSTEVVSGGDVGIPLLPDGQAALLPQNIIDFGADLDIPTDQIRIYLAVRELAHARLFRHARWLRLHVISSITEFARGIRIDGARLEEAAESFDPANPEQLRNALVDGSLIPPKTEVQLAALGRLETMLALIEGWVDLVTADATARLPKSNAIAEMIRRRRATGGPAESAFSTLVGLELRPRRLREAAEMWKAISKNIGITERDDLWAHPDLLPGSEDIDDPEQLLRRLSGEGKLAGDSEAEFDQALEKLLRGETPTTDPPEDSSGDDTGAKD